MTSRSSALISLSVCMLLTTLLSTTCKAESNSQPSPVQLSTLQPQQTVLIHSLPTTIDPSAEAPYSEIGASRVVQSELGPYREVGSKRGDRLAYFFSTDYPGDLVCLTLTYPDDKKRLAEVYIVADTRSLTIDALGSGYYTGLGQPISNTLIKQLYYFFVPLSKRFAIVVKTSKDGAPAAISSLQIKRVDTASDIPTWPQEMQNDHRRRMGLYWEDPILTNSFGTRMVGKHGSDQSQQFNLALERQITYLKLTGHSEVVYPVVWYQTALYEPSVEYSTDPKKQNRPHPAMFDQIMAARYSQEGIEFWPSIRNWSLPSLQSWLKSPAAIAAGEAGEYVNTVTSDGRVQTNSAWHNPPMVNALHPRVQQALRNLVAEIMDRIGNEPSVKGIALFTTIHSSHGLGTIDQSYDDYTVHQFSLETGVTLPTVPGAVETRFHFWYEWLRAEHWQEWVTWRKQKQTELYTELAQTIAARKPGAKLQLMVLYPLPLIGAGKTVDDVGTYLDEIGLDLVTLAKDPNIIITRMNQASLYQLDLRAQNENSPAMLQEYQRLKLDFDAKWNKPFVDTAQASVIHYAYFEQDVTKAPRLNMPPLWQGPDPTWEVTSPKGSGRNGLAYLAKAVGLYDPLFLLHGGFNLVPQGIEQELQPFTATFSSLPDSHFETIWSEDGLVLRTLVAEGVRWLYLINTTEMSKDVSIQFSVPGTLTKLGMQQEIVPIKVDEPLQVQVLPYELLAWKGPDLLNVASVQIHM